MFNRKSPQEKYPPLDDYQKLYRKEFDGIIDKYLICHESENNGRKLIVYIDADNDIDWIVKDEDINDETEKLRQTCLNKLDIAQTFPVTNLCKQNILRFKIMLGAGYNAALHDNYELVQPSIDKALRFATERNMEQSRYLILSCSTLIVISLIINLLILKTNFQTIFCTDWIIGILFGVLGSYVSIWQRSGKSNLTGLATKKIHYLEAFSRLFCGSIFGITGMLLLKAGLILDIFIQNDICIWNALIAFIAAFNERFIPTIIEHITSKDIDNDYGKKIDNGNK